MGYSLLVFVYDKKDDEKARTGRLDIKHVIFVEKERTADHQTTTGLRRLLENNANRDDILAFFEERLLPFEDAESESLAGNILRHAPPVGYLGIDHGLNWRTGYNRVIERAGSVNGILRLS